ncbi:tRNA (N(6)-L-threonylcarbamoyladenosine(37)-C(2))-methylthiotransferase MtaB [Eubacterium oxidoreducens]|uniref:Threonylcarbamoyladenosine tRNA methylthiotransferase MtaB n=1 Tax=Eubacterium oxidoreducens TaxID=1732 RepID=A0A1G6BG72_EUBOX|nr:tRNA (N(6)-L-threonylcarbamoyladenosine(37)-C(2))-methylthiotransferase MtaB [Eubacterium oxidoreducens]SDB19598.1 threonylcarbamoyladenosine tRNA methylthiotransferase MtaB [Eubacterium oxidoreducens]
MRKAALHNLGCKVNAYETEAMTQLLRQAGYEIVSFEEVADVYVINTCSVTNIADRKSRQMLHRARKKNAQAVVVATGCYTQTASDKLKDDISVDILIGNNEKMQLVSKIEAYLEKKQRQIDVVDIAKVQEYEAMHLSDSAQHCRAFLKVQDGCNQFCSYCLIPYARGRIRSRAPQDVIQEVKDIVEKGHKEVVITGIHLSSYGKDTGNHLIALIEKLQEIEGLARIRLGSLEPMIIDEEFLLRLTKCDKVCPHFHLSLQSGCDATLQRMNRHYTTEEYKQRVALIRKAYTHPAITTDVIVGFPGETDSEYEMTKAYLEELGLYEMHIFKYSKRDGTKAAVMPNQVAQEVKNVRSDELIKMAQRHTCDFAAYYLNRDIKVLFEETVSIDGKNYLQGYTPEYVRVLSDVTGRKEGQIYTVRATRMDEMGRLFA